MKRKLRCQIRKYQNDEEVLKVDSYLETIATEIKIITNEESIEEAIEKVKRFLRSKGRQNYSFQIDEQKKEIVLRYEFEAKEFYQMDIKEEIVIRILPQDSELLEKLKLVASKIEDKDTYEIEVNTVEGMIHSTLLDLDAEYENIKELKGKEVKEILNNFIDYVIDYDKDYPGFADGETVMGNWGPEEWNFTGDENELNISCSYCAPWGAETRKFVETLLLRKK